MMTLSHPPMISTNQTPADIIGPHNIPVLAAHMRAYEQNKDKPGRKVDTAIGEMITRLHAHGYYPDGFLPSGEIFFAVAYKSKCQTAFETGGELEEIKKMTMDEMREYSRSGWRRIVSKK